MCQGIRKESPKGHCQLDDNLQNLEYMIRCSMTDASNQMQPCRKCACENEDGLSNGCDTYPIISRCPQRGWYKRTAFWFPNGIKVSTRILNLIHLGATLK